MNYLNINSNILFAKPCAEEIFNQIENDIRYIKQSFENYIKPCFAIVQIGNNHASNIYIENKIKKAKAIGIDCILYKFENGVKYSEVENKIDDLNKDLTVNGIIMQLPVEQKYQNLLHKIDKEKDIDGLGYHQQANLVLEQDGLRPCTPQGVIKLMEYYNIPFEQDMCIVGRSILVGQSLALMLLHKHATVTVVHAKTKNLQTHLANADVVFLAAGVPGLVNETMIKPGAVIIDIGITKKDEKICGDFQIKSCYTKDSLRKDFYYTPVPGGIGPMTIASLLFNVIKAWKKQNQFI